MVIVMSKINFCIVGCGRIATLHVLGYKDSPDARVYAVCDTDKEKADALALKIGAQKTYYDFDDALADGNIDAVELLVPHHLHRDMAIKACRAKKHVSVQKPMALNVKECDAMIAAAKENNVMLKVYENFVFYPPYVKAKELMDSGEIGDPISIRLKMVAGASGQSWYVDPKTWLWRMQEETCGGGPLVFDDGNHKFSIARYFMGEPEKVFAFIDETPIDGAIYTKPDGTKVQFYEDAPAMITWKYKDSKRYGVFDISYSKEMLIDTSYYACDEQVEITGSKGVIWITRCTARFQQIPSVMLYRNKETLSYHGLRDDWSASFIDSTKDTIDAIKNNRPPVLTGEDGREVVRFSLAAIRSAKQGLPVFVDDYLD